LEKHQLAIQRNLEKHEIATKRNLKELELSLKHDLTLRMGGMLMAFLGIIIMFDKMFG